MVNVIIQKGKSALKNSKFKCLNYRKILLHIDKENEYFWCKQCDQLFDIEQLN